MLEHLFGSKTRLKLLQVFLGNPGKAYFLRELSRSVGLQLNAVRREIANLTKLGILTTTPGSDIERQESGSKGDTRKYFRANTDFLLYSELRGMLLKARLLQEQNLVDRISALGRLQVLILCGHFVGNEYQQTDMLLVGIVNRKRLQRVVKQFEKAFGREVNYTVLSPQEYQYRQAVTDRFLFDVLQGNKIVIIDKTTRENDNVNDEKGSIQKS